MSNQYSAEVEFAQNCRTRVTRGSYTLSLKSVQRFVETMDTEWNV